MTDSLHRQTSVVVRRNGSLRRREFLKVVSGAAAASGLLSWQDLLTLKAAELRKQGMACIVLWMQGGPSQFETFSPKPGHANGGETKAIKTNVSGLEICENLPHLAKVMDKVCLVRSMNSREGSHPRATYLLHTGYLPTASVKHPAIGAIAAKELGSASFDLPSFVRISGAGRGVGGASTGGGLLGVEFDPFIIQSANRLPDNTTIATSADRFERRLGLLGKLDDAYVAEGGKSEVEDHRKLYAKASKLVLSPKMEAFDISKEPEKVREAYGETEFGAGCLLARRLVESGVTFVETTLGNWDTHQDNFDQCQRLCGELDRPFAQLLTDLSQRGMLEKTLVVCLGEFGRTPRINPRGGRDHYPRAFSVVLAGGGVRGGQVIGSTDAGGESVKDRPVGVSDLLRTLCQSLHIDANKENMSSIGRPIKVVDGGEVVKEVFAGA